MAAMHDGKDFEEPSSRVLEGKVWKGIFMGIREKKNFQVLKKKVLDVLGRKQKGKEKRV